MSHPPALYSAVELKSQSVKTSGIIIFKVLSFFDQGTFFALPLSSVTQKIL